MLIHELANQIGISTKTIRYYETIGLMSPPQRLANNYRHYTPAVVERLRFIASARSLGFSLSEIGAILAARDAGTAPCDDVLNLLAQRLTDLDQRLADMLTLRATLVQLHASGALLPRDDVAGEHCICALLRSYREQSQHPYREEMQLG